MDIDFGTGFTIITGETGAGKSIVLGALSLILGERADAKSLRNSDKKTIVEATLDISNYQLKSIFEESDIDYDEQECILRRELSPNGRSRAFINDSPVSLALLRDIATRLVDIHSQHSNMLLSSPHFQLDIIDSLALNSILKDRYNSEYRDYKSTEEKLNRLDEELSNARAEEDYMRFQLEQLQSIHLKKDEDVMLEAEQNKLSNITEIKQNLWEAEHLLSDEPVSIIDNLKNAASRLVSVEQMLPELQGLAQRAEASLIELKDIAATISSSQETLQFDPAQLQQIDDRLNEIYSLLRKHQVQSVNELLDIQHSFEAKLNALTNSDTELQQLRDLLEQRRNKAISTAKELSHTRKDAAIKFEKSLADMAAKLGLSNLQFKVAFNETELSPTGQDAVEFRMAFNKKQTLMPVKDTASGGEISRVMLCIKAIVAQHVKLPTIIFDEVDTGVSGDTASRMGEMMGDISKNIQVIAITHLPQVAAHGQHHLKVYKTDSIDSTVTHMVALNDEQRILEIARMLSGKNVDEAAIENAKSLVKQNQ